MKIPTVLLTLCAVILLDNPVEGNGAKESPVTTLRNIESPIKAQSDLFIAIATDKTASSGKQLPKADSTTDDKKELLGTDKETAGTVSEDSELTTTTEGSIGVGTGSAEVLIVPESGQDTNKKCSDIICKVPPLDAQCSLISENPAVSILGVTGDCCPLLVCTRTDGSFFAHYAGAHVVETRQENTPSLGSIPNSPQMMMTQFFAGAATPSWQNNPFGGFRPPPPPFPFGLLVRPMNNDRNVRPFSTELQISMGRRVDLPLPMQFQQQQTTFQQQATTYPQQQQRQQQMSQAQAQIPFQPQQNLQPTMDRDPQHPSWNDILRERRSGVFNGGPVRNQFFPTQMGGFPGVGALQFQPEFRGQQGIPFY